MDHHADVYGISAHPQRPFVLASASRDTTIRLWSLDTMFTRLKIRALCGENVLAAKASDAAMGGVASTASELAQTKLAGAASAALMAKVRLSPPKGKGLECRRHPATAQAAPRSDRGCS